MYVARQQPLLPCPHCVRQSQVPLQYKSTILSPHQHLTILRGLRVAMLQPGKCVNVHREAQIVNGGLGPRVHPFTLVIAVGCQLCNISGSMQTTAAATELGQCQGKGNVLIERVGQHVVWTVGWHEREIVGHRGIRITGL